MATRALVTGASSGIGRAFALQLAAQGYAITAVARSENKLRELLTELPPGEHRLLVADLSSNAGLQQVTDEIQAQHTHLLVNNAGYSVLEPFYQSELTKQQNILDLNCRAVVTLAHAFLNQAQDGDALINVASVVSFLPTPAQPVYSASKAFIASLSECLWIEHRDRGVYVMGLCPGVTKTNFIHTATSGKSDGQSLPELTLQSSEAVVSEALVALDKRHKAIVVTGWVNRLMMLMPRFMSRHRLINTLAVIGDPDRAL